MVPTVFIVDDEPSLVELFSAFVTVLGCEVAGIASNGKSAVDTYKAMVRKPDLIVMDYRMPIKNGIEATAEILAMEPHQKILLATADLSIVQEAKHVGVIDCIIKPFEMAHFLDKITAITRSSGHQEKENP